jgi:predicted PurR-regulated permease PerM
MSAKWSVTTKYMMGIGLFGVAAITLYIFRSMWSLLILAAFISYLLRPVIRFFHGPLRIPRSSSILIAHVLMIFVLLAVPMVLLPSVINAINFVAELDFGAFATQVISVVKGALTSLRSTPISILGFDISDQLTPLIDSLNTIPQLRLPGPISYPEVVTSVGSTLASSLGFAVDVLGSAISAVIAFFLMIVASIYISRDVYLVREGLLNGVTEQFRPELIELFDRLGAIWGKFLKGELLVMLIIGGLVTLGGLAVGLPGAVFLGIVAALLEIIPNLGPIIATIPALVVALLEGSTVLNVTHLVFTLIVLGLYIVIQMLENNIVVPFVLGDALELHPLVVMLGSVVAFTQWGILGALLAAPVMASAKELARYVYRKIMDLEPAVPPRKSPPPRKTLLRAGASWVARRSGNRPMPPH